MQPSYYGARKSTVFSENTLKDCFSLDHHFVSTMGAPYPADVCYQLSALKVGGSISTVGC